MCRIASLVISSSLGGPAYVIGWLACFGFDGVSAVYFVLLFEVYAKLPIEPLVLVSVYCYCCYLALFFFDQSRRLPELKVP